MPNGNRVKYCGFRGFPLKAPAEPKGSLTANLTCTKLNFSEVLLVNQNHYYESFQDLFMFVAFLIYHAILISTDAS